jgi:glycosyltransferase involved in cell wall biosynthesis
MDLAVVTLARWHRVPLVGYIHTVGFSDLASRGRVWEWAVRRTLRAFEVVVCLSPSLTLDVAPWVAPHLLRVVPNATPPLANDPVEQSAAPRREYALFVSNLIAGKGISDFIGFARRSAELGRQYEFHAYGYPGDERLVEDAQAATLDPSNNFVFHGPLSSEAKYEVMRGAAILVFPSTYRLEALPLTIVESLSVGTPVIAYNIGGIEDLLREGGGYTFEPNDRDAMFDGLDKLLRDPASRHKLRRAALSNYSSNLTPAAYIARWRDVLADEFESRP